jgi:hypothetical protein
MCHYNPSYDITDIFHNYDGYAPRTVVRLDKISIYCENLTKHDILEIKKLFSKSIYSKL